MKISKEELDAIRETNNKVIEAQSRLAHITATIDNYEKQKVAAIMNYSITTERHREEHQSLNEKYNTERKKAFDIDLSDGKIILGNERY